MRPSTSDTALSGFERSLAVVIGINTYDHGIPPLHNAVRDAKAVADSLERQGFEVLRLLDSQATLSSLSDLLSRHLPSLPSPPDRLLIYFAGHGLAHTDEQHQFSGFLLPSDARRDDTASYWPMASLRDALRHLPCRHLLLILDCCFAGAFPHSPSRDLRAPSQPVPLYLERFRHFSSRRSFQLLLSTAHDELASDRLLAKSAQESLGNGLHSPFALALLQGLQPRSPADTNQDGLLTAAELYTFLRDRLVSLVPSHCQQTPSLWNLDWHDGGEFLFLLSDTFPSLPPAAPLSQHSNPYLGLRPFSLAQRHLFFGRERLVDSLLERLCAQPLLLLCGPSGAGKSSLVHAGLLPRLTEDPSWRVPPSLRPSARPFHALSSWLASLAPNTEAPSAAVLASRPRSAAEFLGSFLSRHPEHSVLLVIDPLEELVTACLDDPLRRAFLRVLSSLLQLSHPRLHLLLLLRSDFEPHFLSLLQPSAIPSALWHGGRINLPPMNRDELRRCIEKPAEACVLFFSPGLVERLLDDVEQMPGALPLLSVALSELFDAYLASGRDDRTLCFEDYHHIGGGIAGALQRRAELVFSGTPPPSTEGQRALPPIPSSELPAFQRTLRNVLLRMVAPEGGELARRRVSRSELEYPHLEENARVQRALRTLEASRLVVANDDGGPCVEPAHDALLSAWPRLHDWARHAQRELILLRRVSHAATEWHRHRHTTDFLWADARLDQLGFAPASLRRTDVPLALPTASPGSQPTEPLAFNAAESEFLRTSATRRRFLRTRRYALALTMAVTLVALTVAALFQAKKATGSAEQAELQQRAAEANAQEARRQKEAAEANAKEAQKQQQIADINASEAQRQKETAEANAKEARRQQEAADASASEAQRQKETAEANALEAQKQQQLADANAREALAQKNVADTNAREAQRQKETAEANAKEAQKQQQLADTNAREALEQRNTSEANAREARNQQEAANANAQEAQKQQQLANTNAQEARKQQEAAETNFREARKQQETAATNAREAQRQQEAAEASARVAQEQQQIAAANAREAQRQQEAAEASAREAQRQKDNALASARLKQAEGLIVEDPTKALLVLLEIGSQPDSSSGSWLQAAWEISQHTISNVILTEHGGKISVVEYSPDGSRLLTASSDGTIRIWRADGSGTPITLSGHSGLVTSATFSPDGSRVLTFHSDFTARVWRADGSGSPIFLPSRGGQLTSAIFSPDGSRVLTTSYNGTYSVARLWQADGSGTAIVLYTHKGWGTPTFSPDGSRILTTASNGTTQLWHTDGPGTAIILYTNKDWGTPTFSPDGSRILTTASDGTARIWRVDDPGTSIVLPCHTAKILSATFSPDGSRVLTTSDDGTARIWYADGSGTPIVFSGHMARVTSATFNSDSSHILTTSSDGTVRIWRTDGSSTPVVIPTYSSGVKATFSPVGSHALVTSGRAIIWRADDSGTPIVLSGHLAGVTSATFSPDGSHVVTTSSDGTARIWPTKAPSIPTVLSHAFTSLSPDRSRVLTYLDQHTAQVQRADGSGTPVVLSGHKDPITSATFSPDSSRVLTTSYDGTARLWHADGSGTPIVFSDHTGGEKPAIFSPDGSRVLTTTYDGMVRIWHADGSGTPIVLTGHTGWANLTFSPDGSRILTTSDDGTVRVWRADGSGIPIILTGQTHLEASPTFSSDGAHVLTTSDDGTVRIWRADGSSTPIVLSGHTGGVGSAAFSPDGSRVLTASNDGTVRIWRADGAGIPMSLTGPADGVRSVTFSSDGSRILTTSGQGIIRLWHVDEPESPITLTMDTGGSAFFLPDGLHVGFESTRTTQIWPITSDRLRTFFRSATTVCLSVNERGRYLFESLDKAREGHERCERLHNRFP